MSKMQLLRPGFMIALTSRMKGGIEYETLHEESDQSTEGVLTEEKTTKKTIFDVEEHEKAVKVRGLVVYQIRRLCVKTPFCLLCPEDKEAELDQGIKIARQLMDDFNAKSVYTKIRFYVLKAKLLANDEQTAMAIAGEMRSLLAEMSGAIEKMNPEAIREAIAKATQLAEMMQEKEQGEARLAIELARTAAREMAKTIKKKGSVAIDVVQDYRVSLLALEKAQKVFLDYEEPPTLTKEEEAPQVAAQDLDFGEEVGVPVNPPMNLAEALDLDN